MKITVTHSTRYHYEFPAHLEPDILRLRPRMSNWRRLLAFDHDLASLVAGWYSVGSGSSPSLEVNDVA